jgi:hypothetical protein
MPQPAIVHEKEETRVCRQVNAALREELLGRQGSERGMLNQKITHRAAEARKLPGGQVVWNASRSAARAGGIFPSAPACPIGPLHSSAPVQSSITRPHAGFSSR